MATKIKGDAIKEGSIPLSALNDEVKDKIENAGGADWNAQEGEAGYIENKPCYVKLDNGRRITLDNANITLSSDKKWYEKIIIPIGEYQISLYFYNIYGELIHYVLTEGQSVFDTQFGCKFTAVLNESDHYCDLLLTDFSDPKDYVDTTFAETKLVYEYDWEIVQKLDSAFLPNTVIKTTPQTLSDTDKNQALANLGIADLLEALKPVQLSEEPPLGNVTQEQLDEIGLTEKAINNILNGYTNKICQDRVTFLITHTYKDAESSMFKWANFEFEAGGRLSTYTQFRYIKDEEGINIDVVSY